MPSGNTQFSIAVHLLAGLGYLAGQEITSGELAASINTSPSFVRRVLSKLSKAGLVRATPGKAGACSLGRRANDISLLEIYKAVGASQIFSIHAYPVQKTCPVSCSIKSSLGKILNKIEKALEKDLAKISLAEVIADIKRK